MTPKRTAFTHPVEGGALSGEICGQNPKLILLHGFGGSRAGWDCVCAALPPSQSTLRYDLRGFGASAADPNVGFSHSDDLLHLMDAQNISGATLVGLSMGGGVALDFALTHPDRVTKLMLISPMIQGWEWSDDWRGRWKNMVRAARGGDMALAKKLWADHPLFQPLFSSSQNTVAAAHLQAEIKAFSGQQWIKDAQNPVLGTIERLHTLPMPTMLLSGAYDLPDFLLMADVLCAAIPTISRIDFPDAGHMLSLEKPHEVAAHISRFTAGV